MSTKKKSKKRGRKKRKLNTRLLTIVALIGIMLAGVVGGLIYLKIKGGVSRNMAAARAFLEEDQHIKALRSVGKVLYQESGNQDAHTLRIAIYEDMVPETPERASQLYREYLTAVSQHAQFTPESESLAIRALDEWWRAAMARESGVIWSGLEGTANRARTQFKPGSPAYNRATFLLGMARMWLGQSNFLGDVDQTGHVRFPGEAELIEFIELEPENDEGLASLAFGRMAVARQLGIKGRDQQESKNLEMAQEFYDHAIEINPDGPATLLAVVRHLFIHELVTELRSATGDDQLQSKLDELNKHLADAERVILAMDGVQRYQVLEMARFLALVDLEQGHERAGAVLRAWIEAHPTNLGAKNLLAQELQTTGDLIEAEALVKEVIETPMLPVSLESERQQVDKITAVMVLFGIIADRREADDNELLKREAHEARDLIVSLLGGDTESATVLQVDGHLAYADGQYATAVAAYERALRLSDTLPAEVLRKDADALERIGQQGTAVSRLEAASEAEPRSIGNRLLLAALHGRMRNPQAAILVIETIPEAVRAENPEIARLEQSLRLTMVDDRGRVEQAEAGTDVVLQAIARADKLDRGGHLTEAYAELQPLLEGEHSEDVRILIAAGQIESKLGNREAALAFVQKAADLQPGNRQIEQMAMGLSSDDPVEILRVVVDQQFAEGEERDVAWFVSLQTLAAAQDQRADTIESTDAEAAATARATAQRARDEAAPFAELIESAFSRNTQAFAYHFDQLLTAERFEEAEALLPAAREGNWDSAEGNLAEAGFLMASGRVAREAGKDSTDDFHRAVAAARRATEVASWHGVAWETLAIAAIEAGNLEEARSALQEVIQRDPNDIKAIRQLAALHLQEGGDKTRAVSLLADASRRFPTNRPLRETWLQIEAAHGDPALALSERYRSWKQDPNDRQAALWYAGLMAVLPVDRAYVLDNEGRPSLSGRAWLALNGTQQTHALEQLKEEWLKRIDNIADDLANSPNRTLREAMQHATVLREAGRREEMLSVLSDYLEAQRTANDLTRQAIQVASFMSSSDRFWEAKMLLESYRDAQDPEGLEIDSALGEMLHLIGSCEEALPYLTSVGDATGRLGIRLRAADCLIRLNRLKEASRLIAALAAKEPDNYQIAMLTAGLHRGHGMVAEGAGDIDQATSERAAFRAALERASEIDPSRTAPFVELVESLVIEYRRTLDRRHLEEAMRYLKAASNLGESAELVLQRADVQDAMGDPRQAVLDLEAYLRNQPRDKRVRSRLTDAYVTAGMPGRAIDSIEQAIGAEPRDPYWHGLLGDHLRQSGGDFKRATRSYINAWRLEPTRRRMTALTDVTRTNQSWDYEAAVEAIEENAEHIANDPRIIGLRARAENGLGLTARARESLREARAVYAAAVESGTIPELFLENWYEDLYVLYPDGDVAEPLQLRAELIGDAATRWDHRGLARFHALRGGDDLAKAVELQIAVVAEADSELLMGDLRRLGAYQLAAGQDQEAAATFKRILESTPDDAVALNNYAYLLATLLNDPQTAEPLARRAVALRPREPSFIDTMALIQTQLGNHEAALSSLLTKLSLRPNDGPLLQSIATTLSERLDRPEAAVPYAQQALALDPRGVEALDLAGWIAWQAGQQAKGRDWVGQSIRRQPTASAHLHMARILAAANEMGQARDHLQQAEHLAGDGPMREQIKAARSDLDGEG